MFRLVSTRTHRVGAVSVSRGGRSRIAAMGGLVSALVIAAVLSGQAASSLPPPVLRAHSFVISDRQGRPRALLHFASEKQPGTHTCPTLTLLDRQGNMRVQVTHQDQLGLTGLVMKDSTNRTRVFATTTAVRSNISLSQGGPNLLALLAQDDVTGLSLARADGTPQVDFIVMKHEEENSAVVQLYDGNGQRIGP